MLKIPSNWENLLQKETSKNYFKQLELFIENEYKSHTVYPSQDEIFTALELTSYEDVKVVVIGQDPYHQNGQAHGLSFSVKDGCKPPPSLRNIYKEISNSMNVTMPQRGDLTLWAKQGVLLINSVLTVRDSEPNSHKGKGWEQFTDSIIELLNERQTPIVFMLWGNDAKKKIELVTNPKHLILTAMHPSPLSASRGFFGCNHFNLANEFLSENNVERIKWSDL